MKIEEVEVSSIFADENALLKMEKDGVLKKDVQYFEVIKFFNLISVPLGRPTVFLKTGDKFRVQRSGKGNKKSAKIIIIRK